MHVGLVMECDYREGRTQEEAFAEAMSIAEIAETQGLAIDHARPRARPARRYIPGRAAR